MALELSCCVTLGKTLIVVSFGVFIHEELAVSSQSVSLRVNGVIP